MPPLQKTKSAFTLLEIIAVMAVLSVLTYLAIPNFKGIMLRAQAVRCQGNMRSITVGLHNYLPDNENIWPQGPSPDAGPAWEDFWLSVLQPYGITPATWRCPSIAMGADEDAPKVHYMPTMFPPVKGIANRWSTHPWLIERGSGHGQGALICFPDGSVKSFDKVLAELGAR
ncbi:MAG: type II secretion system protein [Chthoniobacterales bacterium]